MLKRENLHSTQLGDLSKKIRKTFLLFLVMSLLFSTNIRAQDHAQEDDYVHEGGEESVTVPDILFEHVLDAHIWHFTDSFTLYLPVIAYTQDTGLQIFSSHQFYNEHHQPSKTYEGFSLLKEKGSYAYHIIHKSGTDVLDLSITKNVAMLFLVALVLLLISYRAALFYKKNPNQAPKGIAAWLEPIIIFLRDDVIKPNVGKGYEKYLPYLVNLFFFILLGNLMGLLPGAANLTGNITLTMMMALLTFIITNVSGNRQYWKHVFWTPGVPFIMKFIIVPVEIIGLFTKPFALLVRLFVAMTAGHFVVLTFILLGFHLMLGSYVVEVSSVLVAVVINLIEILVALIQAYVFTMFSALYIGMATEEHH